MRARIGGGLVLLLAVVPVGADDSTQGKLVRETWDAAYLQGAKVGFYHTSIRAIERDGQKRLRTTQELQLNLRRFNAAVQLRAEIGDETTPDGKVTGVFMRQFLDKGEELLMTGQVVGKELRIAMNGGRQDKTTPWNDQVVGLSRQEALLKEKQVKPGDRYTYQSFEPSIQHVVKVQVAVKDEEEVEVLKSKKRLLRVETVPDPLTLANGDSMQLPGMTTWLDKDYEPVLSEMELPALGNITLIRTTGRIAKLPGTAVPPKADVGLSADIRLNMGIPSAHDTSSVVYRITLKDGGDVAKAFAQDDRQAIKEVRGNSCELHVRSIRTPPAKREGGEAKDEFLKSNFFITSDDPQVQKYAQQAVGRETDPWKKARLIESWVRRKVHVNSTVEFTTAARVAKSLEGDCRHHAVLSAAMCRAVGVPSRTAIGVVYVNKEDGPVFGFHMWTEVFVRGQWLALDATLGRGFVGAAHLKITDHSWHDTQSLTPVLPVVKVVGKLAIEVVRINGRE